MTLAEYFEYDFVRYAMIVSLFVALCSSLLGVTLVLKRLSFIGDGLSHVAFGASAVAVAADQGLKTLAERGVFGASRFSDWLAQTNNMLLILPITILAAIALLATSQNAKLKGDAALAMYSVGALGIGYLIMNRVSKSANISGDVCAALFGSTSILTLSKAQVWLSVILSVFVVAAFVLLYNKVFAITFDEDFTRATGVGAKRYNLVIAIIIAVIIVLAMSLMGALLVSALVIFPSLSAMRVFKSFRSVTVCAVIVSVICAAGGLLLSIVWDTPVGSTIVLVDIAVFAMFACTGAVLRR